MLKPLYRADSFSGPTLRVERFNGVDVLNLAHLVYLVDKATSQYLEWHFEDGVSIVFDRAETKQHTPAILAQNAIAFDRSADLREAI